jgi:hypothetical protein
MNFYKMANPFSLMTITKHFVCKFLDKIHTYFLKIILRQIC